MDNNIQIAQKIIYDVFKDFRIEIVELYLFGSRAKGNYRNDSDWDFFVVVNEEVDFQTKRKISQSIRRKLSEKKIVTDIIIQCREELERRKDNTGYLSYYVLREGVLL